MRSGLIPLFMRKFIFAERLSVRRCISNLNEHRSERRQNKTREWRGGTRRDPQLTSRLRPPSPPPPSPLSPSALGICWSRRTTRTYIRETLSLPSPLSPYHPFLRASSAVRVFKGRTKATGNCCRLFRRYGWFYICPSRPILPSPSPSLSLSLFLYSVHVCLSFSSLFIYLPLLPSTISRVGTYRGGKSSDNGGFG